VTTTRRRARATSRRSMYRVRTAVTKPTAVPHRPTARAASLPHPPTRRRVRAPTWLHLSRACSLAHAPPRIAYSGDYAQRKFGDAKSISSDQFFGDEHRRARSEENQQRLGQFSGARAISSAEFFGREEENNMSVEDIALSLAQTDLSQLGSAVAEGAGKVLLAQTTSPTSLPVPWTDARVPTLSCVRRLDCQRCFRVAQHFSRSIRLRSSGGSSCSVCVVWCGVVWCGVCMCNSCERLCVVCAGLYE